MGQPRIVRWLLVLLVLSCAGGASCQTDTAVVQGPAAYSLRVAVDEVSLSVHAADANGLPIHDLKPEELGLLDNGQAPRRILVFHLLQDAPIRAGILMDTSESMGENLPGDRAITIQYAQKLLRQQTDQAFLMGFGYVSILAQPWTSDPAALIAGVRRVARGTENPRAGTAIFDSLFRACFYEFGKVGHAASGNFILLFSDGEDNASHVSEEAAVGACQRTNTAIYAFRAEKETDLSSAGARTLRELALQTGGRVFHDDDSEAEVYRDLRTIEADLRNQYRLVYKPAELKHDGSFHTIEVHVSDRVGSVVIPSGYYAPAR